MRSPLLLLALLFLPAGPASAQVTVDLRALDALPKARAPAPRAALASPATAGKAERITRQATAPVSPPPAATPAAPGATVPANAAGGQSMATFLGAPPPPDAALPSGNPPAPPPATVAANAAAPSAPPAGEPAPVVAAAVRLNFAPSKADLGTDETEMIKQLVEGAPRGDSTTFNVVAYATPTPDDPSAARRLSLSRALAVRSALMADGVASSRIFVRALGGQGGDGPPDRADVSVLGTNAPPNAPNSSGGKPP
jgi:outer membrane protein OmpA-like peptidoglycan-associated protein